MNISIALYRARIGTFNNRGYCIRSSVHIHVNVNNIVLLLLNIAFFTIMCIILLKCGDIEIQPGPENILDQENSDISSNSTYCSFDLKLHK